MRRRSREPLAPDLPTPKRPYRDSILFYAVLSGLLVLVAYLTAGGLGRALVFAAGFFVVATLWSWWKWRQRLRVERAQAAEQSRASRPR